MKCKKCGKDVKKSTKIMSGNSQYLIWKCEDCDTETMQCIGLGK